MSKTPEMICVGHYTTSSWADRTETYSTFHMGISRPKTGISYLPMTCKVCGKALKVRIMSKGREFTIRFALAFFGIVGVCIALIGSLEIAYRIFGGIAGVLAACFSFQNKEGFAISLVSENPDGGTHALIFKKI